MASVKSKSKTPKPKPAAKKTAPKTKAKPAKKTTASAAKSSSIAKKQPGASKAAPAARWGARADLGKPVDAFFAKQAPALRPITEELRKMIARAAPDAGSAIKWGMPFYAIGAATVCAIAAHKAHVNLILAGPPGTFADPDGLLSGEGKTGRHLKIKSLDELPRDRVRAWLDTAAKLAREST